MLFGFNWAEHVIIIQRNNSKLYGSSIPFYLCVGKNKKMVGKEPNVKNFVVYLYRPNTKKSHKDENKAIFNVKGIPQC